MASSYAGLYPLVINRSVDGNPIRTRKWVVNVGEGQVEYPLFAMAADILAAAGYVETGTVIDDVMVWKKEAINGQSN
jgi:hypothetical protein